MADIILDFEKPIEQMAARQAELEESLSSNPEIAGELKTLKKLIQETKAAIYSNLTPWQRVQMARHPNRPYTLDYIERIFTGFMEFHGDRRFSDDPAVVGGFAKLDGRTVMVIGTQKGRNTRENVFRNFGCPHPEGYRKALRLMKIADLAGAPIITFIDTPGAFPGVASEERHIGEAIAVNLRDMFLLKVPVIAVIIGEGGSGGALGIGIGNRILVLENSYYSVITPEGCAAILWKDRKFAPQAAETLRLTARDLTEFGIADVVVPEPLGGAQHDYDAAAEFLARELNAQVAELKRLSATRLREQRYAKFRQIGHYVESVSEPAEEEASAEPGEEA